MSVVGLSCEMALSLWVCAAYMLQRKWRLGGGLGALIPRHTNIGGFLNTSLLVSLGSQFLLLQVHHVSAS